MLTFLLLIVLGLFVFFLSGKVIRQRAEIRRLRRRLMKS